MKVKKIINYYHSGHLFSVAKKAATSDDLEENDPLISIMFSVLALEAFINESGSIARMLPTRKQEKILEGFASVMSELEDRKESLLVKYHMALLVFSGATWDEGAQPFQDFKLLLNLRNSIVHMKTDKWELDVSFDSPEKERELKQYPKFVSTLIQKDLIDIPNKSTSWLDAIAQPKVGKWACGTAEKVTAEFIRVVPDGHFKESLSAFAFKG